MKILSLSTYLHADGMSGVCSPRNISEALQQNSVTALSFTTEVMGNLFLKCEKTTGKKTKTLKKM